MIWYDGNNIYHHSNKIKLFKETLSSHIKIQNMGTVHWISLSQLESLLVKTMHRYTSVNSIFINVLVGFTNSFQRFTKNRCQHVTPTNSGKIYIYIYRSIHSNAKNVTQSGMCLPINVLTTTKNPSESVPLQSRNELIKSRITHKTNFW